MDLGGEDAIAGTVGGTELHCKLLEKVRFGLDSLMLRGYLFCDSVRIVD